MNTKTEQCLETEDSIAGVLEGLSPSRLTDHVADCDHCRDLKYDAEIVAAAVAHAGADFQPSAGFAERMIGLVEEARPDGPAPTSQALSSGPRTSGVVTTGASSDGSAASTELGSAATEFAPMAIVDVNATILEPPKFMEEAAPLPPPPAPPPPTLLAEPAPIVDPYVPTHKTLPLSAVLRTNDRPSAAPAVSGDAVVEATTGRNNTGPAASGLATSGGGAGPSSRTLASAEPSASPAVGPTKVDRGGTVTPFRKRGFLAALVGGMAAAAAIGVILVKDEKTDEQKTAEQETGWKATVASVTRASTDKTGGLEVCQGKSCSPLAEGGEVPAGASLKTDSKTRARIKLADGEWLAIDRNSEVLLPAGTAKKLEVVRGLVVADMKESKDRKPEDGATIKLPQGEVKLTGTKVAATVTDRRSTVEVVRGKVEVTSASGVTAKVRAGEEATIADRGEPVVAQKSTLSDVLEWSSESADDVDAPALKGLGELRAKKPGTQEERAGAVKLTKHDVKVRVVDVVARTEVEEVFTNQTDEELEGIFRFPLPPGAQIEKLALEVDGELIEGAFVDRDRGAAIWRGVIQNAAPKAPRPREEIVWVPGPWRDPALLEWQRGGRFELRIFPIPKRGSRRVVLTYTQTVPQSNGVRRFTYPLAHDGTGNLKVDDFNVDVQVLGHDKTFGVETRGYQLAKGDTASGGEKLTLAERNFIPAGDLTVEYVLPDKDKELTTWAYEMASSKSTNVSPTLAGAPAATSVGGGVDSKKVAAAEAKALVDDSSPYVAMSLRPKLPRFAEGKDRLHVIVVDSSRSMVGERFARATRLAASMVREMDRRDQFMVLACDTTCQPMGATDGRTLPVPAEPSAESAQQVESFLGSIEPDGGSNLLAAVQAARTAGGARSNRELRIVYLGDGTPTVGPTRAATIEAGIRHALPAGDGSVVAVALGADADTTSLSALARGGNGVMVPYVPGQRVSAAAVDVLAAAYGSVLSDVEVVMPAGLGEATPKRLDPIPAGGEAFVFARMTSGKEVQGDVIVRGRVGSEKFEQKFPAKMLATTNAGNAFVPRMFAAAKIADLEKDGRADDKDRIVALSKQFNVASRHTSLIVLESEAMFKAFGLEKKGLGDLFTGEQGATSASSDVDGEAELDAEAKDDSLRDKNKSSEKSLDRAEESAAPGGGSSGLGGNASQGFGPRPAATSAASAAPAPPSSPRPEPAPAAKKPATIATDPFAVDEPWQQQRRPGRRMIPMRKVFDRKASFSTSNSLAAEVSADLRSAETASKSSPDSRDRTIALYKALVASGRVGEALEVVSRWSQRDALDADAVLARADLAAMNGDRERAIRILSGLADVRPSDKAVQKRLVSAFTQMGAPEVACQHRMALADLDPNDVSTVANAVRCSQDQGFSNVSQAFLDNTPSTQRERVELAARTAKLSDVPALSGDLRVTASWTQPADLDFALIDKNGKRLSWLGSTVTNVNVSAKDATSFSGETVAFSNLSQGSYTLEVVRSRTATGSQQPVSGEVTLILPGGESRKIPFTLNAARGEVGSVRVFFTSRLVPVTDFGF
jgi:antitoxin (DNA-binding transcriptional repressor) of toxin-antitoxin stability system